MERRVQSVALKLVVDREAEIDAFNAVEYWNLAAIMAPAGNGSKFKANLHTVDGKRVEKETVEGKEVMLIPDQSTAGSIVKRMQTTSYIVSRVERKEKQRHPVAPFITSTLQQEASRHYRFSASKTMSIAQSLYEGVDLGSEGPEGLITYMRTDSVRTAPEGLEAVRSHITGKYGEEFLPPQPRLFKTKKGSQDAHEAIRPTNLAYTPEFVKPFLNNEQNLLYLLVWKRFVASQMKSAIYDTVSADISTDNGIVLRATGSIIKFPGFLAVYEERKDEEEKEGSEARLPDLQENQNLDVLDILSEQAFTKPPPRFSEASLVKELEKSGIGRPSTYATIMNKIQSRDFTTKESGRLKPTDLGKVTAQMLETSFSAIMNVGFTAEMENHLEAIAERGEDWKKLIRTFWTNFIPTVEIAEKEAFVPKLMTELPCPKCGKSLQKIWARSKYSGYPECDYTAPVEELSFNKEDYAPDFEWEQSCPKCNSEMILRHGRYGPFLGCTKYPDCTGIVNIPRKGEMVIPEADMPACPAKGCSGQLTTRRSRYGKLFYSCSTFPECDVIVNDLDDLQKKYPDHERTAYVKKQRGRKGATTKKGAKKSTKTTKTKKPRAPTICSVSPELQAIVGAETLPRPDIMKKVWDYIREKGLQDPNDKRTIRPDSTLGGILGTSDPISMFKMTGGLAKHIKRKKAEDKG